MRTIYLQQDLDILADELEKHDFGGHSILITGATGLIGSLCLKAVAVFNSRYENKINAIGLARSEEKVKTVFSEEYALAQMNDISFIYQVISDSLPEGINCEYIIHTANPTTSKFFMTNPVEVIESIYTGTKRVLDYAVENNVKGVVYLSSMEVFGRVNSDERITEEQLGDLDIHNVRSCYSEGKRLAELLCASYASEYGLSVKIARLAQTFGAGVPKTENRVFAQLARSAIQGQDIILHTRGESIGNYCYTADVIRALLILLKEGEPGGAYTVVNEETTRSIAEMARLVADHFSGGNTKVVFDIPENNTYGYAPDTKMRLSSKKLRELGWKPIYSLKEMYERMIPSILY